MGKKFLQLKKHIPNLLTLGNLLCGCLAVYCSFGHDTIIEPYPNTGHVIWPVTSGFTASVIFLFFAFVLDFFDGFTARILKASSKLGKELDSLADLVSFGLAPGFISLNLLKNNLPVWALATFLFFILMAALRLAKFNVSTDQSINFKGLPTPSAAIASLGLAFVFYYPFVKPSVSNALNNEELIWLSPLVHLLLGILMISSLPLFSFKFKNFTWKDNWYRYVLIVISLVLLVLLKFAALPVIILVYILMSILFKKAFVES